MEFEILKDNHLWQRRIRIIRNLYLQVEMLSILEDNNRKCNMFILPPHILENYMNDILRPNGLGVEIIGIVGSSDRFTHGLVKTDGSNELSIHGIVYKDKQDGLDFKEAYLKNDNKKMGELLGYPKCCIKLFDDMSNSGPNIMDLVVPQALGSIEKVNKKTEVEIEGSLYNNAMLRYIGVRFSPHMPCSPHCEESISLAKTVELAMQKMDSESANYVKELLSMKTEYRVNQGVTTVTTPVLKITGPNYDWGEEVVINYTPL